MNESDTRLKLIDPALKRLWSVDQITTEYRFTAGRIVVSGEQAAREKPYKADYLLSYRPDFPLAVVEAKSDEKPAGHGLQQAIGYAQTLDVPFAYSTNGLGFVEHDFTTGRERELSMDEFPGPDALWDRYCAWRGIENHAEEALAPYHYDQLQTKRPRYYQRIAINRTVEAVLRGRRRVLLVMATGSGKTFTALQIVQRLRRVGRARRVLYLADRNCLVDPVLQNDFRSLASVATKVTGHSLDPSYEVYFALYQQLVGEGGQEHFRALAPGFFDLIIVDECHRGSAADNSTWRRILEYFSDAVQIGMTATPKETSDVSNAAYFGEPIYTYSLRQGIEDGFLAPYKVIRPKLNVDAWGWRPTSSQVDDRGEVIEDRIYEKQDFDRSLVIRERTEEVAHRITEYLKATDRLSKTIVFCMDIEHAERMREALVNENADIVAEHPDYIQRITGDLADSDALAERFLDEDEPYPAVAVTSELLSTGVDCRTCRLIVLENYFGSEGLGRFKQIVGRGTRVDEARGKLFFTILDFRDATRLFADPDFDGDPVIIFEPNPDDPVTPPSPDNPDVTASPSSPLGPADPEVPGGRRKYYVHGVEVHRIGELVEYYSTDGTLKTESLFDFSRKSILAEYDSLDRFLTTWSAERKKQAIVDELWARGVDLDALREVSGQQELGDFDLICHVAFDQPPLTRSERARNVRKRGYLFEYQGVAREVLEALLDKYADSNLVDLDDPNILMLPEFRRFGNLRTIMGAFGGREGYVRVTQELEDALYAA